MDDTKDLKKGKTFRVAPKVKKENKPFSNVIRFPLEKRLTGLVIGEILSIYFGGIKICERFITKKKTDISYIEYADDDLTKYFADASDRYVERRIRG